MKPALILRRNGFASDSRADFQVIERGDSGERIVGRICSGAGARGDKWLWAISGWGSALSDDLEDAKAKFRTQWGRRQPVART